MAEPIIFDYEQYEQSFKDIVATASAAPESGEVLAVHMWEWSPNIRKLVLDRGVHTKETDDVLAMLANEEGAVYDDSEFGQSSRYQTCDGENGMVAIACTALQGGAPCNLYNESISGTGMLFSGAAPVFAYHMGAGSVYREDENNILSYNHGSIPIGDPKSKFVKEDARTRLKLMKSVASSNYQHAPNIAEYNEVCVNATLGNVGGILVEGARKWRDGEDAIISSDENEGMWKEFLSTHQTFAERIKLAFDESDMIAAKIAEKGLEHVPTVVIYQPNAEKAEDRMVHFPPTLKNRMLVEDVMKSVNNHEVVGSNANEKSRGIR